MRLVLADDHVLFLDALQAYLKELEPLVEVITATNFSQALQYVTRSATLDLVLLDVNMPGMNGLEGLKLMKQRFPDLPVVLLSGYAGARQIREAMSCGAAGFIPKDLPGEALVRALELVLAGGRYGNPAHSTERRYDRQ
jgi:DNA-binding NarL/FixJ family response regulator